MLLLEPDRLLCRAPRAQPAPMDDAGVDMRDGRALVVVRIGRVRVELGPLQYADAASGGTDAHGTQSGGWLWTRRAGIGMLGTLCALCALLAALAWAWRRRQGEHERTYRRIQMQMEQMESQVRTECKQVRYKCGICTYCMCVVLRCTNMGNIILYCTVCIVKAFAELQTDVLAELDGGVDDGAGIPLLERREFVSRLLFRDCAGVDAALVAGGGYPVYSRWKIGGLTHFYLSSQPIADGTRAVRIPSVESSVSVCVGANGGGGPGS